jgi:hypothetical protein
VTEHSCHGTAAAPVAMAIIKKYLQKLDPVKYSDEALKQARTEYYKKGSVQSTTEE